MCDPKHAKCRTEEGVGNINISRQISCVLEHLSKSFTRVKCQICAQKGFERKYELDQDQEFRVQARRDKLFGHWLAQRFGMSGEEEKAYVIDVVDSNFEIPGDEDMLDKVKADIAAKGVSIEDAELNAKLSECMAEAHKQVIESA